MHVLHGLRRKQAAQRLPELRRRLCAAADPPLEGMAAGRMRCQACAVGQARASEVFAGRCRRAFGAAEGYCARTAIVAYLVIASQRVRAKRGPMTGSAKQSILSSRPDGLLRR